MYGLKFKVFDTICGKDVTDEKNFMLSPEGQLMVECDDIDCPMVEAESGRYEVKVFTDINGCFRTVAVFKS